MRTRSPGHLKTFDYRGLHRYSLTFCTDRRVRRFTRADVVELVLTQISRAATENQFAVIAYCFMPDHLHLLVEGQADGSDCRTFISRAKQYSGFHFSKAYHEVRWQRYGFEHVLHDDQLTIIVARYILSNPIRARLVDRPEDYPFMGSLVFSLEELLEGVSASRGSG